MKVFSLLLLCLVVSGTACNSYTDEERAVARQSALTSEVSRAQTGDFIVWHDGSVSVVIAATKTGVLKLQKFGGFEMLMSVQQIVPRIRQVKRFRHEMDSSYAMTANRYFTGYREDPEPATTQPEPNPGF